MNKYTKYTIRNIIGVILLLLCMALFIGGCYIGKTNVKLGYAIVLLAFADLFFLSHLCRSGWL